MAEDLYQTLMRFHREIAVPDIERIVDSRVTPFRDEVMTHLDGLWKRFDRLESEYYALKAAVDRVEQRIAAVEQKLDKMALRSELIEIKDRVATLEHRIAEIESQL